jgi:hypothetical protein
MPVRFRKDYGGNSIDSLLLMRATAKGLNIYGQFGVATFYKTGLEVWEMTDIGDTLCKAPGRLQFWKYTHVASPCVPYYDQVIREPLTGQQLVDTEYILDGHWQNCPDAGDPTTDVKLKDRDGKEWPRISAPPQNDPNKPNENKPDDKTPHESIEENKKTPGGPVRGPSILRKRDGSPKGIVDDGGYARARDANLEMCDRHINISGDPQISAKALCDDRNSFGADMVARYEEGTGVYCDMCRHEWYLVCTKRYQTNCWDMQAMTLKMPFRRKREEGVLYPEDKIYERVDH